MNFTIKPDSDIDMVLQDFVQLLITMNFVQLLQMPQRHPTPPIVVIV